jgi:hypothetical protein
MRIDQGRPQPGGADNLDLDLGADRPPDELFHAVDEGVHVGGLGIEGLTAGEGEQTVR